MHTSVQTLPKSQAAVTVDVSLEELKPHVERAAKKISEDVKIEGFRPGFAPYDIVKQRVGEMAIYEAAAELVVRTTYPKAILETKLEVIGSPKIDVVKLAPGNPLTYKATVTLLPDVKLSAYEKCRVDAKKVDVTQEQLDRTLKELQKMQTKETVVDRPATAKDKVVVDMNMFIDNVALDGGQAKDHAVYLEEPYYIPGLPEQLLAMKAGDKKSFTLSFPKEHYQKHLAGRSVDFEVTMKSVAELSAPPLDDAFAAELGKKTLQELTDLLRKNLTDEAERKESDRQEVAMLGQMIEKATFSDIPELLLANEVERMMQELEANIVDRMASSGIAKEEATFDHYLESVKKTRDDLRRDFLPEAMKRVKTALVVRAVALQEKMAITDDDVAKETEAMMQLYAKDTATQERIRSEEGQDYLRGVLRNRTVIAFLKEKIVK